LERTLKVSVDGCLDPSSGERELSHSLDFVTDSGTPTTENAFIWISLKKRGDIVRRKDRSFPGVEGVFHPIFVHQRLKTAVPFLFASRAGHRVVEEDELELESSRFNDLRGVGEDLHPFFRRGEAGGQEFGLPFLLNDAEAAGPEGNEPPIVTEVRDPDPSGLSGFENGPSFLNHYLGAINLQFNRLICHHSWCQFLVSVSVFLIFKPTDTDHCH
jgi:hypothetical protein